MGRAIHFNEEQLQTIKKLYTEQGYSQEKIAKIFNVSKNKIATTLKELNISKQGGKIYIPEEHKDKVVENYIIKGMGLQASGREFGYSQRIVETILCQRGVKKRNYIEAKQKSRKYTVNDNYFKYQNENMAYILGFLAADGCVSKKENLISIQLQKQDEDFLNKIKIEVESDREIKNYITNTGRPTCKMEICSSEWKKDLFIYNIVPNKTFILQPPTHLDNQFYIDYIRGYFDGDGSICVNLKEYKNSFEIVGASKNLMEWIRNVFANQYAITNNGLEICHTKNGTIMYKFAIRNKEKIKKIRDIFYKNPNCLCLERKKEKMYLL